MMKLSEIMQKWRADRPDEWRMDEFIRCAKKLEDESLTLSLRLDSVKREFPLDSLVGCEGVLNYPIAKYNAVVDILNAVSGEEK